MDTQRACDADGEEGRPAVGARVRVNAGTDTESCGLVIEDFGELSGQSVCIGTSEIVGAARQWAVALDDGGLVFVDSEQIILE